MAYAIIYLPLISFLALFYWLVQGLCLLILLVRLFFSPLTRLEIWAMHQSLETMQSIVELQTRRRSCNMQELSLM